MVERRGAGLVTNGMQWTYVDASASLLSATNFPPSLPPRPVPPKTQTIQSPHRFLL